jgi:hypothetical protein
MYNRFLLTKKSPHLGSFSGGLEVTFASKIHH